MLKIIPSKDRYFSDMGKMNSYFLFSFDRYYDPLNEKFGNLRVFNDDFLLPNSGFDMHPHKYYEILTLMLDGTITHKDSLGNMQKISKNEIQVTNTSTGIMHSEINENDENINLYQIWFAPNEMSQTPIYYKSSLNDKNFENNLVLIASGIDGETENKLSSKVSISRGIFDENKSLTINYNRYVFLYITKGKLEVNGKIMSTKDQLRAFDENELNIKILEKTDFILIKSQ